MVYIKLDSLDVAIPLRSNIKHPHAFWTDKTNNCGLDFSKAVIINDKNKYIDFITKVLIRTKEFQAIKGKDHIITSKMKAYIKLYKKAYKSQNIKRNALLCKYSTLQYFHKELGIK